MVPVAGFAQALGPVFFVALGGLHAGVRAGQNELQALGLAPAIHHGNDQRARFGVAQAVGLNVFAGQVFGLLAIGRGLERLGPHAGSTARSALGLGVALGLGPLAVFRQAGFQGLTLAGVHGHVFGQLDLGDVVVRPLPNAKAAHQVLIAVTRTPHVQQVPALALLRALHPAPMHPPISIQRINLQALDLHLRQHIAVIVHAASPHVLPMQGGATLAKFRDSAHPLEAEAREYLSLGCACVATLLHVCCAMRERAFSIPLGVGEFIVWVFSLECGRAKSARAKRPSLWPRSQGRR